MNYNQIEFLHEVSKGGYGQKRARKLLAFPAPYEVQVIDLRTNETERRYYFMHLEDANKWIDSNTNENNIYYVEKVL